MAEARSRAGDDEGGQAGELAVGGDEGGPHRGGDGVLADARAGGGDGGGHRVRGDAPRGAEDGDLLGRLHQAAGLDEVAAGDGEAVEGGEERPVAAGTDEERLVLEADPRGGGQEGAEEAGEDGEGDVVVA